MRPLLLLLALVACGGDDAPATPDARVIDPTPYYQNCIGADDCPQPYQCTEVNNDGAAGDPRDVCLVPCASDDECAAGCCCRGFTCGADVAKEGFCAC